MVVVCVGVALVAQAQEFSRAQPGYTWSFPRDHGLHPEYESEWWYYTGQLYESGKTPFKDKPRLGFQLTFFRRGARTDRSVNQDYMAHAAVTDVHTGRTLFESRIGGGPLGLAGVAPESLRAWSGDWIVEPIGNELLLRFSLADGDSLGARQLRLHVTQLPRPWLQGIAGYSAKSECSGCASMYYSLPRLAITAHYREGGREHVLTGLGWMDHEFMTNSLSPQQSGWDWMGLMLKDGRSLMVFRVRSKDRRSADFVAAGIFHGQEGRVLPKSEWSITPKSTWTSPRSGAQYPVAWRVQVPSEGLDLTVTARVPDCELGAAEGSEVQSVKDGTVTYWEGPVASSDEFALGYLEMTGYAGALSLQE